MNSNDLVNYAKKYYSTAQVDLIKQAAEYATKKHENQFRKSGKPYIDHPLNVSKILIDWQMDLDSVLAGILHDVVEDTGTPLSEIDEKFGSETALIVDGVTKVSIARSGMGDLSTYLPQTADNLSKLLIGISKDIRVIIVKLADRLHNLRELEFLPYEKQLKIARESIEVFAPMADRLGMGRVRMEIEELAFSYLDPIRFKQLEKLMRKNLGRSTRKLGIVRLEVEQELKKHNIKASINGRVKSIYSLHKKMLKKDNDINEIYDLMALRIILNNKEDCYRVLGILHSIYQPMITRIKDYISVPKTNGYQSLHTTVVTPHKQIVEFQIRTKEMHEFAEKGLAATFHYHAQKSSNNYIKSKKASVLPANMQWMLQLQNLAQKLQNNESIGKDQLSIDLFNDRIFVYSPQGDIFNLPENAMPLDFAYQVHSKIGKHASGFRVNGRIHPFDKPLQNGDMVEVIVKKSAMPKTDWLDLVTTSHAKSKLRNQLKSLNKFD